MPTPQGSAGANSKATGELPLRVANQGHGLRGREPGVLDTVTGKLHVKGYLVPNCGLFFGRSAFQHQGIFLRLGIIRFSPANLPEA